jgi:hypothetical protein
MLQWIMSYLRQHNVVDRCCGSICNIAYRTALSGKKKGECKKSGASLPDLQIIRILSLLWYINAKIWLKFFCEDVYLSYVKGVHSFVTACFIIYDAMVYKRISFVKQLLYAVSGVMYAVSCKDLNRKGWAGIWIYENC